MEPIQGSNEMILVNDMSMVYLDASVGQNSLNTYNIDTSYLMDAMDLEVYNMAAFYHSD